MPWLEAQGEKKGWGKRVTPNTLKRCLVAGEHEHSTGLVLLQPSFSCSPEQGYFWFLPQTC